MRKQPRRWLLPFATQKSNLGKGMMEVCRRSYRRVIGWSYALTSLLERRMSWTLDSPSMRLGWPSGSPVVQGSLWVLKSAVDMCPSNETGNSWLQYSAILQSQALSPSDTNHHEILRIFRLCTFAMSMAILRSLQKLLHDILYRSRQI